MPFDDLGYIVLYPLKLGACHRHRSFGKDITLAHSKDSNFTIRKFAYSMNFYSLLCC